MPSQPPGESGARAAGRRLRGPLARLLMVGGVCLALSLAVAFPYGAVVAQRSYSSVELPLPPGGFAVGRVEGTAVDGARNDRKLAIWTWYPAASAAGTRAVYAPGAWAGLQIGLPLGETRLERVRDQALLAPQPAAGTFPVLVLLPGLGFAAPQYAGLAENLASRGYIVIGVTPTGSANLTVLSGRPTGPTPQGNPSDFTGEQTAHDQAIAEQLLHVWVEDARFVAGPAALMAQCATLREHVDPSRLAYVGHSFGGTAALEACHEDSHCRAAVDLDGALYGSVATDGLDVSALIVGHDGSCVTGDCQPASPADRADMASARAFLSASTGTVRRATVSGTGHLDFTDFALYYWAWPLHKFLGLGDAQGRDTLTRTGALISATLDESGMG